MRRFIPIGALTAALVGLSLVSAGCGGQGTNYNQVVGLGLRTVVGSSTLGTLDAYTDGKLTDAGLGLGDSSPSLDRPFNQVRPGTYTLSLREAGSSANLLSETVTGVEGEFVHLIALGTKGSVTDPPRLLKVDDERSSFDGKYANFRFVNVAPSAGNVDVYVTLASANKPITDVAPDLVNVGKDEISALVQITGERWRFRVTRTGTKDVIYDETLLTGSNTYGILLLTPDPSGTGLDITPYGTLL